MAMIGADLAVSDTLAPHPFLCFLLLLQDLLPQCCFLLVSPGEQSFLWVGKSFATGLLQVG